MVAQGVVQVLEAVEVDDEEGDPAALRPRGVQALAEAGGEGAAIDQAGERVGLGEPQGQFALGLQFGDARSQVSKLLGAIGHGVIGLRLSMVRAIFRRRGERPVKRHA